MRRRCSGVLRSGRVVEGVEGWNGGREGIVGVSHGSQMGWAAAALPEITSPQTVFLQDPITHFYNLPGGGSAQAAPEHHSPSNNPHGRHSFLELWPTPPRPSQPQSSSL